MRHNTGNYNRSERAMRLARKVHHAGCCQDCDCENIEEIYDWLVKQYRLPEDDDSQALYDDWKLEEGFDTDDL